MCRNDRDCLMLPGAPFGTHPAPVCLQIRYIELSNGASAQIPYCFDQSHAFDLELLPCQSESTCGAGQPHVSCVSVSNRSEQAFCASGLLGDANGALCSVANSGCGPASLCLRAPSDQQLHCTDVSQSLLEGSACIRGSQCASGDCWDRRARAVANSPATARCTAVCRQSMEGRSDCVGGMTCVPIRLHDNGTEGADDDTVMGFCLTQTPENVAEQCNADAECTDLIGHGDKCNLATKACYRSQALVGDACTNDGDCSDGDACLQFPTYPFPDGYCVRHGCDLETVAADNGGCPPEAVCVPQGGGTASCQRGCLAQSDCRSGYSCVNTGNANVCQPN
jgi:hypothetical protein